MVGARRRQALLVGLLLGPVLVWSMAAPARGEGADRGGLSLRVDSISPVRGGPGTEVELQGQGFGSDPRRVSIRIGRARLQVLVVEPTRARARLPDRVAAGTHNVTLSVGTSRHARGPTFDLLSR